MPEKKIVEMPAEVTVIVDKVSEVTQAKSYGYESSSETWLPLKTDSAGRVEVTQLSPYYLRGLVAGSDADGYIRYIRTDSAGRPAIKIDVDGVGLAKETTLSSIDGKITKCDTDNIAQSDHTALKATVYSGEDTSGVVRLIRTDTTGRATVVLDVDNIGLAKETTLSSIDGKITTCNTNDIRQSDQSLLKATTYPAEDTSGVVRLLRVDTTGMVYARVVEQPVNSYTTDSITSVGNVLELDLGTFTAAGAGSSNDVYPAYRIITWQVNSNSTGAVHQVALQGSLDNSNWFDLDQSQTTGNEMRHVVNKPVRYLRANVVDMGDATEIKVLALLKDA
ncbi:MAG: hypothetical protein J7J22_04785 [Candidatus Verstraetearchaeota archaeon]|nr:hypothetical protein [Candidatus Verstraetearchaeota archaeon]